MVTRQRRNVELLRQLLLGLSEQSVGLLAVRNALRTLPFALNGLERFTDPQLEQRLLRALILANVIGHVQVSGELRSAASRASKLDAARSIDHEVGSSQVLMACDSALLGLSAVLGGEQVRTWASRGVVAGSRIFGLEPPKDELQQSLVEEIELDSAPHLATNEVCRPLWSLPAPSWFESEVGRLRSTWSTNPNFDYWLRWWDGVFSGNQLDWELQKQVALLPDDIWQQGPAAVAEAIRQIELDFAISATPNAEDIARDEHGLFYTLPVSTIRPALFRAAIEKVQDDLTEIRAAPRMANCLAFLADDLRRLDDHFVRYADQPLRIHDVYLKTLRHIEALQRQGLLPADTLIEDLHHDLDTGAVDIRRSDNEVAKTVKARIGDRLARLKADRRDETEAAVNGAAAESRDALKEELKQDFATATDPAAETEDKEESGYRLFSRLLRMGKKRKEDLVKTADDIGKVSRGAEGLSNGMEAAQGWWNWVTTHLPWFGG